MAKQVEYTQREQDLARSLTTTMETQEDAIRLLKQRGATEADLVHDKAALRTNAHRLNALLERIPEDYTPVVVDRSIHPVLVNKY